MPGLRLRGGIGIVEVAETRGSPEISTVMTITSLDDAARFFAHPRLRPHHAVDQVRAGHQPEGREGAWLSIPPTLLATADEVIE